MTTFDRYLFFRLLQTFAVFFIATYGLYVVFDLFTNFDDFFQLKLDGTERTQAEIAVAIIKHYGYQSAQYLELAGPVVIGISAIAVLGLLEKNTESHPILAAGIPALRLLKPLLLGEPADDVEALWQKM